jgi:hypothetical protein
MSNTGLLCDWDFSLVRANWGQCYEFKNTFTQKNMAKFFYVINYIYVGTAKYAEKVIMTLFLRKSLIFLTENW